MIHIREDHAELFREFRNVDDFLQIDIDIVRDFKNRKSGRFEIDGKGFYIKKHFECGIGAILDELFHLRKPHIGTGHEVSAIKRLTTLGIDTLKVVAFGRDGRTLASQRSFLVTEELTNVKSLEDICGEWPTKTPTAAFKKALISQVARTTRTLHENGMNHRDFYICHFLLDITGCADEYEKCLPKLFLIDLHRAQQRPSVPVRWRVKDIGGLYFSAMDIGLTRCDIFRFIRLYTGKSLRQTFQQEKRFWKAVRQRAVRTYCKNFGKSPFIIVG
jgi:heptose I phosphotransferase